MKKSFKILSILMVLSLLFTGVGFANPNNNSNNSDNKQKKVIEVKDKENILKVAEEYNFEEPEKIVEVIFSYGNYKETSSTETSDMTEIGTLEWGADEIYFTKIITTEEKGELLRSSNYVYPGGTMTVTDSRSATFSTTIGLSAAVVSAEIGFDVTKSYSVSDSQNIVVPYGKTYNVKAYVNNQKKSFEIWEDDVILDDYLGTGKTTKPIGVIFVIYEL